VKAEAHEINAEFEDEFWWYVGRRRILLDLLGSHFGHDGNSKPMLLDLGCGTGATLMAVGYRTRAIGVDTSPLALIACKRRGLGGRVVRCDLVAPPFRDKSFDVVMLLDVLEHMADDRETLREACRLLRCGGLLMVTVPAYPFIWGGEDYVSEHHRRYLRGSLKALIAGAGIHVRRSTYFNTLLFPVMAAVILFRRFCVPESRFRSNVRPLPVLMNKFLSAVFSIERFFLRWLSFPYGGSILCLGVKENVR